MVATGMEGCVGQFTTLSRTELRIGTALQALSALLQPQGQMLQVTPAIAETRHKGQENMPSPGSDALETEDRSDKPSERREDLSPAALQQIVLQSGVIKQVLQAVRHAGNRSSTGNAFQTLVWRCLCALGLVITA